MRLAFDTFELDIDQRRLLKGGVDVHLQPKAFELLRVLVEARPKALSKQEILDAVWPEVFVSENNLATVVRDLRTALGDDAQTPHYIRTAYGYGYAFAAAAAAVGPPLPPLPGRSRRGRVRRADRVAPPRRHRDPRRSRHYRRSGQQERHENRERRGHRSGGAERRPRDSPRIRGADSAPTPRRGHHRYGLSAPSSASPFFTPPSGLAGAAVAPSCPWRPR
jgi:DNA-binding winged helix-turn-helix (wHTH) protein